MLGRQVLGSPRGLNHPWVFICVGRGSGDPSFVSDIVNKLPSSTHPPTPEIGAVNSFAYRYETDVNWGMETEKPKAVLGDQCLVQTGVQTPQLGL
jgi:hypothetical protein